MRALLAPLAVLLLIAPLGAEPIQYVFNQGREEVLEDAAMAVILVNEDNHAYYVTAGYVDSYTTHTDGSGQLLISKFDTTGQTPGNIVWQTKFPSGPVNENLFTRALDLIAAPRAVT